MNFAYLAIVAIGIILIIAGFYFAYIFKGKKAFGIALSLLMPLGLIITLTGIILTVLPNFFGKTIW